MTDLQEYSSTSKSSKTQLIASKARYASHFSCECFDCITDASKICSMLDGDGKQNVNMQIGQDTTIYGQRSQHASYYSYSAEWATLQPTAPQPSKGI